MMSWECIGWIWGTGAVCGFVAYIIGFSKGEKAGLVVVLERKKPLRTGNAHKMDKADEGSTID